MTPSKSLRFGFQMLDAGDSLAEDGYAFTSRNIEVLDRLLALALEDHHHNGLQSTDVTPDSEPELTLDTSQGSIPAGRRARYVYTLVDENNLESAPSPEAFIDTPDPIDAPQAAALDTNPTGGTLQPGQYFYVLSAYQDFSTSETKALNAAHISVPLGTMTNENVLTLPALPDGATGFNVYRRGPGGSRYFFLESIDMEVATPPTEYVDDGSVEEDCDRTLPSVNSTYSTNTITVTIGGATPVVPEGYTWKVYRTYTTGNWENSLLAWVVEETTEGSGIITPELDDVGGATTVGSPPSASELVDSPSKVQLTDVEEVQGYLPPGRNIVAITIHFDREVLSLGEGPDVWCCEYERAEVLGSRITAKRDESPFNTEVIVDVEKYDANAATPSWATIYPTAPKPQLEVAESAGLRFVPDENILYEGDLLGTNVLQLDGDPDTEIDFVTDVTVQVYLMVQHADQDTSFVWSDE